jgi:hypothetical protein
LLVEATFFSEHFSSLLFFHSSLISLYDVGWAWLVSAMPSAWMVLRSVADSMGGWIIYGIHTTVLVAKEASL